MERPFSLGSLEPEQLLDFYTRGAGITYLVGFAAQMQLDEVISSGAAHYESIAKSIGAKDAHALYTVLTALTWLGIFEETGEGYFANNALSLLLREIRPQAIFRADESNLRSWRYLGNLVMTGKSANDAAFGEPFFHWLNKHPTNAEVFHAAMTNQTEREVEEIRNALGDQFRNVQQVVDVGGGEGFLASALLDAWPHLRAVLYDRAEIIQRAKELHRDKRQLSLISGDFFDSVPPGDYFTLKRIAFNWKDEEYVLILQNIVKAMRAFGRATEKCVLVIEPLRPSPNNKSPQYRDVQGALLAATMALQDGYSRTVEDHEEVFDRVGLKMIRRFDTPSLTIMKAVPF